jgi:hypothetical protein
MPLFSPGKHIWFYESQILFKGTYVACLEKFSEFGSQLVKEEEEDESNAKKIKLESTF